MSYIDVHCHLDGDHYGDMDAFIGSLSQSGIEKIVAVGFDLASSQLSKEYAEKYPNVYFTAGYHPTELKKYRQGDMYAIEDMLSHPKCVAIGEIGLDYHYDDTDKNLQIKFFEQQIELAYAKKMPMQIHSRDCAEDMLKILKSNQQKLYYGAMLHCYSHSLEMCKEFAKLNLFFSFGGTSTYSGSKKARRCISFLSPDVLLTETDSPYLPPRSKYGTFPNTPQSIPEILANIAEIKGMSVDDCKAKIWQNAHTFFPKLNN